MRGRGGGTVIGMGGEEFARPIRCPYPGQLMKAKTNLTVLLVVGWAVMIWMQHYPLNPDPKALSGIAATPVARREVVTTVPTSTLPASRPDSEGLTYSPTAERATLPEPTATKADNPRVASAPETPTAPLSDIEVKAAVGRRALEMVGADSAAEQVWLMAINDSSLPEEVRQNLIEDLNEDGLSDPKNPTLADLPLIENRLTLIAALGPVAMDDVNAAAFREAYKDLAEMLQKLTQH